MIVLKQKNVIANFYFMVYTPGSHFPKWPTEIENFQYLSCCLLADQIPCSKGADQQEDSSAINQGIALTELVIYIEDAPADNEYVPIFKLPDLF